MRFESSIGSSRAVHPRGADQSRHPLHGIARAHFLQAGHKAKSEHFHAEAELVNIMAIFSIRSSLSRSLARALPLITPSCPLVGMRTALPFPEDGTRIVQRRASAKARESHHGTAWLSRKRGEFYDQDVFSSTLQLGIAESRSVDLSHCEEEEEEEEEEQQQQQQKEEEARKLPKGNERTIPSRLRRQLLYTRVFRMRYALGQVMQENERNQPRSWIARPFHSHPFETRSPLIRL